MTPLSMQSARWLARLASPRMPPVSALMDWAMAMVVSRLVLIWATPALIDRAVFRIVDAVLLMPLAVPLIWPAEVLIELARPSMSRARPTMLSSLPYSG